MGVWKSRDLTYFGKILIITSFVLSVIGYEIEMRGVPVKFEKEIISIIWGFIWDGKTNKISRNVCNLSFRSNRVYPRFLVRFELLDL